MGHCVNGDQCHCSFCGSLSVRVSLFVVNFILRGDLVMRVIIKSFLSYVRLILILPVCRKYRHTANVGLRV